MLDYRPDQGTGFVNLAPAALLNYRRRRLDSADSTRQPGDLRRPVRRARRRRSAEFREYLVSTKAPGERLREVDESSRQLNSAIDRASRFLNLASLASVLLAAVAVAMGARRYAARHIDTVALMKCMGASQGFVLAISIIELTLLAVFAVAVGALLGYLAQVRSRVAAAGSHPHRTAPGIARAAAHRARHRLGHAHRIRAAAVAAIEEHAAGPGAAQERERAAAAIRLELCAGARGAVRDSVELGARHRIGALRSCRRARRGRGAHRWRVTAWCGSRAGCAAAWASPGAMGSPTSRGAAAAAWCKSSPLAWG